MTRYILVCKVCRYENLINTDNIPRFIKCVNCGSEYLYKISSNRYVLIK